MKHLFTTYPQLTRRILEIFFPLVTWGIITLPIWLSPFHPAVVAYFLLLFDIYFFYKSFTVAIRSTISYLRLKKYSAVDWYKLVIKLPNYKKIYHGIIITNYGEQAEKIRITLNYLKAQDFPTRQLFIILAMEQREGEKAKERARSLIKEFKSSFGFIHATFHPDLSGEVKGKASNSAFAGKFLSQEFKKRHIDSHFVTITSCDADSLLPKKYFSYLTYAFLTDTNPYVHFYWAPVLLYSNFWDVPLPIRLQATISSILRLSELAKTEMLIQISTYSLSLKLLERIGFWDTDIIPEDWHVFLQAYFTAGEEVKTVPLYLITTRDAVNGPTLLQAFRSRYEQEKRWAWGITDVPYAIGKLFTTPSISFLPKFLRVLYVIETHLFWPSSFFLLTLGASIPALVNPVFSRTSLGYNLPKMSGFILTVTMLFLLVLIVIDVKSRPKRPASYPIAKTPLLLFQWLLLPVISFFFSSLPALEAHTRLLFGKRLEYKVTEKI